ncbi:hypothetical protein T11_15277 [Trichinella zimbabwensis]|uniref:Uncharacterized protein n=1 Tax=Trichinella zimbabwensis TaxID=268475 RepID=A0A0V1GB98_9BILA|nr:hypothetical protein T11_15277 [Trichinella zimbabwensis]
MDLNVLQSFIANYAECSPSETLLERNQHACISVWGTFSRF